ncbi:pyrimidine reductase family protein [Kitasatospora sp. GP82]|uniref:pyrimidine reductase family protein n=1 Tax=Kitasatospora sp. GP82 TaxID=3035089 RepID=UPI002473B51B|nr:pyrimidine reductase family protein [Kitasatospora sp. GP82]MDH6123997.1 riboflavin biosynthesis pyrimidine reductase [Kitasatospora sp. GP82]
MQRLYPQPVVAVPEPEQARWLAEAYRYPGEAVAGRPWVRACMVSGLDGAAAWQGRSGGLSGAADAQVLAVQRALADVVLVGAGTARSEGYGPADVHPELGAARIAAGQEPAPAIAVVSARLELDPGSDLFARPAASPGARTLVITARQAPTAARRALERVAEVVVAGEEQVDPPAAVRALAARGWYRILSEGGPQLLGRIWAAGLLDELCLTVSPLITAGDASRILRGPGPGAADRTPMALASVLTADGFLFTRYTRATCA